VEAGQEETQVWICISDSGPGIPPQEQEMIFLPFFRGSQGRRIKQGMGLGLSIAKDLVTAHGGQISVESKPGAGSRFTIWLPKQCS
jgi:signal transduction histidine kinase